MQSPHLYWPSDRKLFRQRSRARVLVPAFAVLAVACMAAVFRHLGMS